MRSVVSERACNAHNAFQVSRLVQALFLQAPQPLQPRLATSTGRQRRNTSTATASARQDQEDDSSQKQLQGEDVNKIIKELSIDHVDIQANATAPGDQAEKPATDSRNPAFKVRTFKSTHTQKPKKRANQRDNSLIDPSSLQNTIDLHNAANNRPKPIHITHPKTDTKAPIMRPSNILEAQRLQKLKKHFLEKLEEVREKEKNLVVPQDDLGLKKNFLGHLKFEKKEGKVVRIAGEKAFLHEVREKNHHGGGHKYSVHDYEGAYVEPAYHEVARVNDLPWVKGIELVRNYNAGMKQLSRLDSEIRAFYAWIQATPEEKQVREKVQEEALAFVRHYLNQYDAEIFGSQRTGIGIATSDVDIRIFLKPGEEPATYFNKSYVSKKLALDEPTVDPETTATSPATQDESNPNVTEMSSSETTSADQPSVAIGEQATAIANDARNTQPTADPTSSAPDAEPASVPEEPQEPRDMSKAPRRYERLAHNRALQWLIKKMDYKSPFMMAKIRHSRYPLVQAVHRASGLDIQFVCANDSSKARAKMQEFIERDRNLVPVFTLLKTIHDVRGLGDVYRGGIGSYTLFMMLVTALRLTIKGEDPDNTIDRRNAGQKFLAFLKFWGKDANLYESGFSVDPAAAFDKLHSGWTIPEKKRQRMERDPILKAQTTISLIDTVEPYLLCLQDPADPLNDLGAKSFGIKHIQATYARIHDVIYREMANRGEIDKDPVRKLMPFSFLFHAVGPAFNSVEGRRGRMMRGRSASGGGEGEGSGESGIESVV